MDTSVWVKKKMNRNRDELRFKNRRVKGCLHYMILSGRLCHTLQIMQCKLSYYTVMHDFGIMHKSCGIELVLFAMTKSCHFSQSTCRSLRLMSFQEKQAQGYTCSIHNSLLKV